MYIQSSIRTAFGRRQLPPPPMVRVSLTRRELDSLIHALDRDAMQAERDGRFAEADSLAVRAVMLRDAANDARNGRGIAAGTEPIPGSWRGRCPCCHHAATPSAYAPRRMGGRGSTVRTAARRKI